MCSVSVTTIVHQRKNALINLIKGLNQSEVLPAELVIVYMNEKPYKLPETLFPIKEIELNTSEKLPLAQARNLAKTHSANEHLIFLDADCVPHPGLVGCYIKHFSEQNILWLGPVRYLQKGATDDLLWLNKMDELSKPDPVRNLNEMATYEYFWSLNFGCSKAVFDQIGGFDESYKGYGAEDTDFAFSARKNQVAIGGLPVVAYHQYHPSYHPPLNHLHDIVANANRFKQKWQVWPMEGWLKKFQEMGFIDRTDNEISTIKEATENDLTDTLKP